MDKEAILAGLNFLKKYDKNQSTLFGFKTFGADKHKFKLNPPLAMTTVESFESEHRIVLPADYKEFITEIGDGGAGPGIGLLPLQKWDMELYDVESDFLSKPFPHKGSADWNMSYEGDPNADEEYEAFEDMYFSNAHVQGAIRLSHYGCAIMYMLVVSGEEYSKMWVDDRSSDHGIYRACDKETKRTFTFEEWYMDWLKSSIEDLEIEESVESEKSLLDKVRKWFS